MREIKLKKVFDVSNYLDPEFESNLSYNVGYDNKLYAVRWEHVPLPSAEQEEDRAYLCAILVVDANADDEKDRVEIIKPETDRYYRYACPLGDNILLVHPRTSRDGNGWEDNACIIDRDGKVVRKICLGDGISHVLTFPDGRIAVGYFDEGVYGDDAIGSAGLVVWDSNGNKIWENPGEDRIDDVYNMQYGKDGSFWYYAYTEFNLVKVDNRFRKTVYAVEKEGCDSVVVDPQHGVVLFDGGYCDCGFYSGMLDNERVGNVERVVFKMHKKEVAIRRIKRAPDVTFLIDKDMAVYTIDTCNNVSFVDSYEKISPDTLLYDLAKSYVLSHVTYGILEHSGKCHTFGDVCSLSVKDLVHMRNMRFTSINEVLRVVGERS